MWLNPLDPTVLHNEVVLITRPALLSADDRANSFTNNLPALERMGLRSSKNLVVIGEGQQWASDDDSKTMISDAKHELANQRHFDAAAGATDTASNGRVVDRFDNHPSRS
ncbi:unnamed protein product [Phytophthora lilii]|uniref:Unnamed protein product n=1 Tax=Phytophthora lilii TaxID=2077276 RepID=A0A9W6Y4F9_9STRA|nr:unnamed protein product [Phytophthora lilii]